MWIHTDTAFVSIVAHRDRPECLLVRSRTRRDLEAFGVPEPEVWADFDADYLWRAVMPREWVAARIAEHTASMSYTNVKAAVQAQVGVERARALMDVWHDMQALMDEELESVAKADYARRGVPLPGWLENPPERTLFEPNGTNDEGPWT